MREPLLLALPPRARLGQVLRSLAAVLPDSAAPLLEAARFRDGLAALRRLTDDAYLEGALQELAPQEAVWLAERLLERWGWLQAPALIPAAAVVAPDEIWIGDRPLQIPITLALSGVEPEFEPLWQGAAAVPGAPGHAVVTVTPPPADGAAVLTVHVRVRARALPPAARPSEKAGPRCLLVAQAHISVRQPRVVVAGDRRTMVVSDQQGRPAAGVTVELGATTVVTGADGKAALPAMLAAADHQSALPIRVAGVWAGRVTGSSTGGLS